MRHILQALLLLLYGAGLRISEALRLTLADVDLDQRLLTIRETKFYKSRLVPLGPNLTQVLSVYLVAREGRRDPSPPDAFLLTTTFIASDCAVGRRHFQAFMLLSWRTPQR